MNKEITLIDTSVLVYAYDRSSEKHEAALKAVETAMLEETGAVSVQNLVEFSRVITEKLTKTVSFEQARNIVLELSECLEVVYYDSHTVADALSICAGHGLHFFDALIVATVEKEKIKRIITENEKDFRKIPWLTVVNPFG